MSKKSSNKTFQRLIIIASSLALVGSSAFLLIEALFSDRQQSSSSQTNTNATDIEQLKAQAQGYEKVLEREPNNSAALQNLVKIRLGLRDYQGAVVPLEKLVKLYPKEAIFQQLLTEVKQNIQEQKELIDRSPTDSSP